MQQAASKCAALSCTREGSILILTSVRSVGQLRRASSRVIRVTMSSELARDLETASNQADQSAHRLGTLINGIIPIFPKVEQLSAASFVPLVFPLDISLGRFRLNPSDPALLIARRDSLVALNGEMDDLRRTVSRGK